MADNFAQALYGGRNDAINLRRQQAADARTQQAFDLEMQGAQQNQQQSQQQALYNLARGYKQYVSQNPQGGQQYYESFLRPSLASLGLGDSGPYDEAQVNQVADQVLAAYGQGQQGGSVQSTYIDNMGNRVAIMRDGSTQVLGQNAPSNQIIDTGNGFFGVNKGNLQAAPVMVGGGAPQQPNIAPGTYQTPAGMVRVGDLTPEQQELMMQDIQAGQSRDQYELPKRDVSPQQFGQQLRSAPKEAAQETFSQPQAVTGPDGQIRYVQFGNRGGTREVQGYSAPPTDRDAKPPTEGERKAATLLQRLTGSLAQLEQAVRESPEAASPSLAAEAARRLPFVGDAAANTITPAARQRVEAAQLDILDAALTLGTGAAYTKEQLEGYRKSYFPQLGDSQATINDKATRLQNIIESAKTQAGRAAPGNQERQRPATPARSGPQPGMVEDGYRFKGGNPADPNSWEQI